ncbi:hypothetical protein [Arthrobacter castelli]|uniref:hypothetical protein n=1 Tax=Arthrobacter castelli TaxID=271431 RepID=UPI00040B6B60|nr:hypothetical protein [Arthrobacter castelli]
MNPESETPDSGIARIVAALDALAAAAAAGNRERYRAVLGAVHRHAATEGQIRDAYCWGRRGLGAAGFDHHGLASDVSHNQKGTGS